MKRKSYLTKRELEIVRRFKDKGWTIRDFRYFWEWKHETRLTADEVQAVLRKALIHQRITDHGYVYYDKPSPKSAGAKDARKGTR